MQTHDTDGTVKTKFWSVLDDGRIECQLCPRYCRLHEGQRGSCFVRANIDNQIVLTSYGRSSGFVIDPIEKKPLNHFYPGTPVLSFGTAGCNLACKFCQNWDISKSRDMDRLMNRANPIAIANAAQQLGCTSVAYTYNDPVIFYEYAIDTAIACREAGIKSVAVTAGYICPEPRAELFHNMDAANVDLKAFNERFYRKITGSHLQSVLETLLYVKHETKVWLEITTLLIPGENDTDAELQQMTEWVVENLGPDVPMHFTAFHPDWKMQDKPSTPLETLIKAREVARNNGMHHVYVGNTHDKQRQSTYCHQCGQLLIGRNWYVLSDWNLDELGRCNQCGTLVPGHFEGQPGHWGSKRKAVDMTAFQ